VVKFFFALCALFFFVSFLKASFQQQRNQNWTAFLDEFVFLGDWSGSVFFFVDEKKAPKTEISYVQKKKRKVKNKTVAVAKATPRN
jgi:hypothetical protein